MLSESVTCICIVQNFSTTVDLRDIELFDSQFEFSPANRSSPGAYIALAKVYLILSVSWVRAACICPHIGKCDFFSASLGH